MKKLSNYTKEEKLDIENEISTKAKLLGASSDWDESPIHKVSSEDLKLCTKCRHLRAYRLQYGTENAFCVKMEYKLIPSDPVTDCTEYDDRFQMTIWDMQQIAVIIETKKEKIGF